MSKVKKIDEPGKSGDGLLSLPDLSVGRVVPMNKRIVWNIYKVFRKEEYYYHTKPLNPNDSIYEKNTNVSSAMHKVHSLNKKD